MKNFMMGGDGDFIRVTYWAEKSISWGGKSPNEGG